MNADEFLKINAAAFRPMLYPNVHLDTFAYCNAKCVFCGYTSMTRPKGKMSMELLDRLLADMAAWCSPPQEIAPIHYGEFFLNPDWHTVLTKIEAALPNTKIALSTNAARLSDDDFAKLLAFKQIGYINFSVYGFFDETYERVMGLPAKNRERAMELFFRVKKERPDILTCVGSTTESPYINPCEAELFRRCYGIAWPAYSVHPLNHNRQIASMAQRNYPYKIPCIEVLACMVVQWNGKVSICCSDPNGELEIGDATKERLLDIWHGPTMLEYQRLHLSGQRDRIPLCYTCTSATMPQSDMWRANNP